MLVRNSHTVDQLLVKILDSDIAEFCFWDALYGCINEIRQRSEISIPKISRLVFLFWRHCSAIPSLLTSLVLYLARSENSDF